MITEAEDIVVFTGAGSARNPVSRFPQSRRFWTKFDPDDFTSKIHELSETRRKQWRFLLSGDVSKRCPNARMKPLQS
jgi:NAD-dependent SIR2 family protein deacetylase